MRGTVSWRLKINRIIRSFFGKSQQILGLIPCDLMNSCVVKRFCDEEHNTVLDYVELAI